MAKRLARVFGSIVLASTISLMSCSFRFMVKWRITPGLITHVIVYSIHKSIQNDYTGMLRSLKIKSVIRTTRTIRATHHFVPPGAAGASPMLSYSH